MEATLSTSPLAATAPGVALPAHGTDLQRLAAPIIVKRRADLAEALATYHAATSAREAHSRAQLVGFKLTALNVVLDALGYDLEPAPQLATLDELLAADFARAFAVTGEVFTVPLQAA